MSGALKQIESDCNRHKCLLNKDPDPERVWTGDEPKAIERTIIITGVNQLVSHSGRAETTGLYCAFKIRSTLNDALLRSRMN